jgi:hypothetical protein
MRTQFVFSLGVSYNQPKLCPNALWAANATTLINSSMSSEQFVSLFVDSNNTVYAAERSNQRVLVWADGSTNPTTILTVNFSNIMSLFVTVNGDIYIGSQMDHYRVDKWPTNSAYHTPVMDVDDSCFALFVDTDNSLYCSIFFRHLVVKKSLNDDSEALITVAGTGFSGSAPDQLNSPYGIFVDINFDLYVSDFGNQRIQLFRYGQLHGITVVDGINSLKIPLNRPSWMLFDADMYMFIADNKGHQLVRSSHNGFRCLVGCSTGPGSATDQLNEPSVIAFDSYGNIYVTDYKNNRIQKFTFISTSCSKYD